MEDIYAKYGVKQIINASGKMTILGGSRVDADVINYMHQGATQFFEIKDLLDKTGEYLAKLLKVESTYIVNSASGAIAQSVAACINRGDMKYLLNVYDSNCSKREIIICKGHNVDYGTTIEVPISMGGGKVVEAGFANKCTLDHIESKINENTAALIYVKSHHCVQKGMPDIQQYIQLGHRYHLPVIVDAAAEEDLTKYYHYGSDIVIYSGTKALEGPTSGLIIGKKQYVDMIKKQSQGIGRVMKVGKENILGLTYAVEKYLSKKHLSLEQQKQRFSLFNEHINSIDGLSSRCVQDGAGRLIIRSEISFDENKLNMTARDISRKLKEGDIKIYTRDYRANEGKIEIDIRDVSDQELEIIENKLRKIIGDVNE